MDDSGSDSGDEAGEGRAVRRVSGSSRERRAGEDGLAGLVIGDQVHIPKRMAPFARALVTVYELARFSDREFDQEEYAKYMHLLISLIHRCVWARREKNQFFNLRADLQLSSCASPTSWLPNLIATRVPNTMYFFLCIRVGLRRIAR